MHSVSSKTAHIATENLRVLSNTERWSKNDLLCAIHSGSLVDRFPSYLPEAIHLAWLDEVLDRLAERTAQDRCEHGRIGYLKMRTGKLVLGATQSGTETNMSIVI